jgi:CRISPR-associated protein Csy1
MAILTERAQAFRQAITDFIEERRKSKEKEKNYDPNEYAYDTWLADAASRAHHLKMVTHPIKFTHSAIKGATSINFIPKQGELHSEIGTHSLGENIQEDFAITDAKHLAVHSLLTNVVVEGRRLIEWIRYSDTDLLMALHDDSEIAKVLMTGFNKVIQHEDDIISSSYLAKQVFWLCGEDPTDNNQYHLLQPMFSSSLEEAIHKEIIDSREAIFISRGTKKQSPTYDDHHTYPALVGRTIGGSNAQNVSPRNNARGGINYLLSSLPPKWMSNNRIRLLYVDSALNAFRWFEDVPDLLKSLSDFLLSDPEKNKETREKREELEQALGQQLALFGESIRLSQEPGWTRNTNCRLPLCEKLWLDPARTELPLREAHEQEDADFNTAYTWGDWPDEVASRFASWLNVYLREKKITAVGDAEHKHWAKQAFIEEINWPIPLQRRAIGGGA